MMFKYLTEFSTEKLYVMQTIGGLKFTKLMKIQVLLVFIEMVAVNGKIKYIKH